LVITLVELWLNFGYNFGWTLVEIGFNFWLKLLVITFGYNFGWTFGYKFGYKFGYNFGWTLVELLL